MMGLYPLRFTPLYKHYPWGGRRFGSLLGRRLEADRIYAESWDVVDHGEDQSRVAAGPLAGVSLHQLVVERREELLGAGPKDAVVLPGDRFPLLLKFLDAAENLSLQVHPGDAMAARLDPPDLGKTEAWYVLAAEPGSRIYAGLASGVDRAKLARAVAEGRCAECMHWFEPRPGDTLLIPAGSPHALGAGILVAEIQQASDTTFRLFDWNRLGPDGRPRALHVEQALEAIDFGIGPLRPTRAEAAAENQAARLVACKYFAMDHRRFGAGASAAIGGDGHCRLVSVLAGSVGVDGDAVEGPLTLGQTMVLPAALGPVVFRAETGADLLEIRVP